MSDEQPPSKEWTYKRLARVAINSLPVPACLEMAKQLETIFSSLERAHDSSKDEVWSDARILDELGDYDACLSPEHVKRLFENAHRLLQHLRRENVRWENAHKILLADNARLQLQLKAERERVERAAKQILDHQLARAATEPRADLQAAAFDLIDVLDAALIGAPDTGLRVRPENYLPVMAAINRVRSITEAASSQPPGEGQ